MHRKVPLIRLVHVMHTSHLMSFLHILFTVYKGGDDFLISDVGDDDSFESVHGCDSLALKRFSLLLLCSLPDSEGRSRDILNYFSGFLLSSANSFLALAMSNFNTSTPSLASALASGFSIVFCTP